MSEQVRHKRGDIGPDGRVFWAYNKKCSNGEQWASIEDFKRRRAHSAAYNQTPEYKAWKKVWQKTIQQTPEYKARQKANDKRRRQTPEYKAYAKAYYQSEKFKTLDQSRQRTPKYKSFNNAYYKRRAEAQRTADAFRMMQAASELSKALTNLPNTRTQ